MAIIGVAIAGRATVSVAIVSREHLARRVGHGAETARLGDAVRGVRAGLAAARLVPQCGGERAEVVRDGLLRLGSGLGFG